MARTEFWIAARLFAGLLLALATLSIQPIEPGLATAGGPCPG